MAFQLIAVAYCVAMACASRLVPLCPCCGPEVRISRIVAAVIWACMAGALFVMGKKRFQLFLGIALLSGVQVANFWQQFRHEEMSVSSLSTWTVLGAMLGAVTFLTMALTMKRKAASR